MNENREGGIEEIEAWAKLNRPAAIQDEQLLNAWHWLRLNGPSSCWTNAGAVIVRMLLLEIFRVKLRSQQRKSRLVKIANRKRKELENGEGS